MNTTVISVQNSIISIKVPIRIKRYGGKKTMILPKGAHTTPVKRIPDATMVKALAKAYFWQQQIDKGVFGSIEDLSKRKNINSSYVSRILRLNRLAPQIKQAILDGTQPRSMSLQGTLNVFPDLWDEQLEYFGFPPQG